MTYLNLIVLLTQLSINESPTFCLLFFAGAEEEEEWYGDWGGEEDERWKTIRIVTMATVNI